jgi:hypothetical protein
VLRFTPVRGSVLVLATILGVATALVAGCGGGGGTTTGTVTGFVRDSSTLAYLSGATVQIGTTTSGVSDASGAFRITDVPTGTRAVSVLLSGYESLSTTVGVTAATNLGDLYLPQGQLTGKGHVSGIVYDSSVTQSGVTVTAGGKSALTKSDGSFVIYNLTPGNVTVQALSGSKSGLAVVTVTAGTTSSTTVNLSITPPPPPSL